MQNNNYLVEVRNLKQHFINGVGSHKIKVKAVDGVSFGIHKGETFGLVGETGCGKTTTGRSIIKLYQPTDGEILFNGEIISRGNETYYKNIRKHKNNMKNEIIKLKEKEASSDDVKAVKEKYRELIKNEKVKIRDVRRLYREETETMRKIQMIFQDPISSLNPRMTVKEIIAEGLRIAGEKDNDLIDKKVADILKIVGLLPEHAFRYPHEFSGGQRQRIGIARALIVEPELLIADEPISALDVSIQAQVINLLNNLQKEFGLTVLFIAHDLSVVKYFSDRIGVMYYGNMVELTTSEELFKNPLHPYTRSLLSAVPLPDPHYEKTRKRFAYVPHEYHNYTKDNQPSFVEVKPGHYILASKDELVEYKKQLK
jgi:oligopeptide transport system ATP-binding protein